jgi:hypothetical protein
MEATEGFPRLICFPRKNGIRTLQWSWFLQRLANMPIGSRAAHLMPAVTMLFEKIGEDCYQLTNQRKED